MTAFSRGAPAAVGDNTGPALPDPADAMGERGSPQTQTILHEQQQHHCRRLFQCLSAGACSWRWSCPWPSWPPPGPSSAAASPWPSRAAGTPAPGRSIRPRPAAPSRPPRAACAVTLCAQSHEQRRARPPRVSEAREGAPTQRGARRVGSGRDGARGSTRPAPGASRRADGAGRASDPTRECASRSEPGETVLDTK